MIYRLLSLILLVAVVGCSPNWHLKQAERHLRKAEIKGAQVRVDTIYKTISVIVPETRIDTVLTVQNFRDTLVFEKDRIVTRIKFDTLTRQVFVQTICPADTVRVEVPVSVTKEIKSSSMPLWGWIVIALTVAAFIYTNRRSRPN